MEPTRCLLMVDIVDSTAVTSVLGEAATREFWITHDRLSRDLLRHSGGREIDRSDGLLGLFPTAVAAARFAAAYHQMLAGMRPPARARAGMYLGPVGLYDADPADMELGARPVQVAGLGKPVAARLMGLALGGQTLASESAARALAEDGIESFDHGHWRFRGFEAPAHVFEVEHVLAPRKPPPDGEKAYRVQWLSGLWQPVADIPLRLPAELDTFVGRTTELRQLATALASGAGSVVTLMGPAGVGKTRLASHYARVWRGDHPGGVYFCDLTSARDLVGVVRAVALALDVPLSGDPVVQLGRAIRARGSTLLILDNCEHVVEAVRSCVERWRAESDRARLLATSSRRLLLQGEQVLDLEPLGTPDSLTLMRTRATALRVDLRPEHAGSLIELVERLDGLPLAMELAVPRLRVMTPPQMVERLQDRFRLLTAAGRRDRHSTLRAALDWSWDLLDEDERDALIQLSVFEGGFTLVAAETVLDIPERQAWVPDLLQTLADTSWIRRKGGSRFDMLRSVHDYLVALQVPSRLRATRRHLDHFTALDARSIAADRGADLENIMTACQRAAAQGLASQAVDGLQLAWTRLRQTGPLQAAVNLAAAVSPMPGLEPAQRAAVGVVAASALYMLGRLTDAAGQAGLACDAIGQIDAPPGLAARIQVVSGEVAAALGRTADAARHLERARELASATGVDNAIRCHAGSASGALAGDRGQWEEARRHHSSVLDLARRHGDRHWEAGSLGNLGTICHAQEQLEEARDFYQRALAISLDAGDSRWEGNTRSNLGLLHLQLGQTDEAASQLEVALSIARRLGHLSGEAVARCNLGLVRDHQGHLRDAKDHFSAARTAAHQVGDEPLADQAASYLSSVLARMGDLDGARAASESVQDTTTATLALLWCAHAEAALSEGDPDRAALHIEGARSLQQQLALGPRSELALQLNRLQARLRTVIPPD